MSPPSGTVTRPDRGTSTCASRRSTSLSASGPIPARTRPKPTGSPPVTRTGRTMPTWFACPSPDDVIPALQIEPRPDAAVILADGYTIAFEADLRSRLGERTDTIQPS